MKAATIQELKQELVNETPSRLIELCLRLARFKKENKELLTYLLFEAHDTDAYIAGVKQEMDLQFAAINQSHVYFAKKTIRKVLRVANKFIRYSGSEIVEVELLLYYCSLIQSLGSTINFNPVISNLYQNQLRKIRKVLEGMHEDVQYEYVKQIQMLSTTE